MIKSRQSISSDECDGQRIWWLLFFFKIKVCRPSYSEWKGEIKYILNFYLQPGLVVGDLRYRMYRIQQWVNDFPVKRCPNWWYSRKNTNYSETTPWPLCDKTLFACLHTLHTTKAIKGPTCSYSTWMHKFHRVSKAGREWNTWGHTTTSLTLTRSHCSDNYEHYSQPTC